LLNHNIFLIILFLYIPKLIFILFYDIPSFTLIKLSKLLLRIFWCLHFYTANWRTNILDWNVEALVRALNFYMLEISVCYSCSEIFRLWQIVDGLVRRTSYCDFILHSSEEARTHSLLTSDCETKLVNSY
jgi:hypothetical protein